MFLNENIIDARLTNFIASSIINKTKIKM